MASKRWIGTTLATAGVVWALWLLFAPSPWGMIAKHWTIALTMAFGSFVAGATCEGGGAVAFPVFTKVLHITPADAKWFTLAIQSVGMTAASLTIFAMRRAVDLGALCRAGVGGAVGILIGSQFLAPHVQPAVVRVLFTMMQCGFAFTLMMSHRVVDEGVRGASAKLDSRASGILVLTGFAGGMVSSLFGHGLDLVTFSVLVLLFRVDERVATPTSVVLMASNSLVGFSYGMFSQKYSVEVLEFWVAAIPVVVIGAPMGAIICRLLSRRAITHTLVTLISIEFATTLWLIPMTPQLYAIAAITLAVFVSGYRLMRRCRLFWPELPQQIEWADAQRRDAII